MMMMICHANTKDLINDQMCLFVTFYEFRMILLIFALHVCILHEFL